MKKEDYFKRKDAVKIVEKNKPKSYKEGINLNKKLRSNEIEKNYTINYKNVYGNDIINKDPLLSKIINIINIHSSEQLKSLERFFLDNEENKKDIKVLSHNSKYMLYQQVISIAIIFNNFDFFLPTYLDFRGRVYTSVDYFSYQAEDLAKSLIEFKEGCIIDNKNIYYVLQYLANLGGKSKLTIKNKIK